ncbi:Hypothetical protein CAP_8181 [Chondromyces apiculatus DSM 436]|uniref:Uncharacterized protein n=1 Tax=Chondromyces apiculatus DSM 436 TaxID=1192034 RepID=A0A017TFT0_9BACT|nr:Hypothetical protein CAP_8181 [Chondromyces apiculatus DSM 436]
MSGSSPEPSPSFDPLFLRRSTRAASFSRCFSWRARSFCRFSAPCLCMQTPASARRRAEVERKAQRSPEARCAVHV